jgi:hypothetical protein
VYPQSNRPEMSEEEKQERKRQQLREKKLRHTFGGGGAFAQTYLFNKKGGSNDTLLQAASSYA